MNVTPLIKWANPLKLITFSIKYDLINALINYKNDEEK